MAKKEKKSKVDEGYPDEGSGTGPLTAEEVSEKYTVPELKYILRENGLKVSGKKQDLVERVLPVLNGDLESTGEAEVVETDDSPDAPDNVELLSPVFSTFGINYEELDIEDKTIEGDNTILNVQGFTRDGLSMSDFVMSMVAASDSSNVDLKMSIPEVSYSDYESTIFTFKNLDLFILPSSDPQSLEFSALMDSLEIITEGYYVNLKGLNLFFKSFPDNGVRLDIGIDSFIYPDFNGSTINFEDLDLNLAMGVDGQSLAVSVKLPKLTLLNREYRVNLSDLDLNISLPDLKLSNLDLSILMSDFHYTNFDDVVIDMDNVDVSHEPILNSNGVDVIIRMDSMDATGLNSFDELFPMLSITGANFKTPATDSDSLIKLTGFMSLLDITQMDLTTIGALLSSGFDLDTYMSNMPDLYKGSLDGDAVASDLADSGFDIVGILKNCDYSCLDAVVLDLTGLIDSAGIDLADFGIDVSEYDLSAVSLSGLIDSLRNSDFVNSAMETVSKLSSLDLESLDLSGLIVGFDEDSFDLSSLLSSLNLSDVDFSGIAEMLNNIDFGGVFENVDLSCLGAIVLDLTGLIDSIGIDLADFGIDMSDYDLSAISLAELIGILGTFDFDMSTIMAMLKLFGIDLDGIDLDGIISSFDVENFDLSSLLASLNLSDLDISAIVEALGKIDWSGIFENADLSCLGAIVLDLTGLIDSIGIDLADLGIDLSDYDLSAISLAELIGILGTLDFDMSTLAAMLKLFGLDLEDLNLDGLIASFDEENFDMSSLLASLNLSEDDIKSIVGMFSNIDFAGVFENCDWSSLDSMVLDLTGLIDSIGIDLAGFGIDLSDYDLSAISLPELIGVISSLDLDISQLDLSAIDFGSLDLSGLIVSFDEENFDLSSLLASLNLSDVDISGIMDLFTNSDVDFAEVFKNVDLSCFGAIVLDLTALIDSIGIDLAALGIDLSGYDLSAISLAEVIGIFAGLEIDMSTVAALLKLAGIELDDLDLDGLIASFDVENFDLSSLLASLNLSDLDISALVGAFTNIDFAGVFENVDLSCLGAIVLDLTGFIDSLGIDLADLGIDLSGYDLSAISLAEVMGILGTLDFDMSTIVAMLKLFGLELDDLDLDGLIASFDMENFDLSSLLASLNLSGLDISGIMEMFNNIDFAGIFENFDDSCLDSIVLNLTGLLDSADIDLASFGIDVSDYDLSAIKLSDLVDAICDSEFIQSAVAAMMKLFNLDWDELDMSGLIASFDAENFDISSLLESIDLSGFDVSGILDMYNMNGFDIPEFLNGLICMFMENTAPEIPGK